MGQDGRPEATAPEFSGGPSGLCQGQACSLIVEADHRIANHLALLATHLRLQAREFARQTEPMTREAASLLFAHLDGQISAVARLHRRLSGAEARACVDLASELHAICAPFQAGLSGGVVIVEDLDDDCTVTSRQLLPLAQIITEVITNALKHAFPNGRGMLLVRQRRRDGGSAQIEIQDHGRGFPPAFDPLTGGGLGFRVVRALAAQLRADIAFESSSAGVRFRIALP